MGASPLFTMKNQRILLQIKQLEYQMSVLTERLYNPEIENSEYKELSKKKKKLNKHIEKLKKKLIGVEYDQ